MIPLSPKLQAIAMRGEDMLKLTLSGAVKLPHPKTYDDNVGRMSRAESNEYYRAKSAERRKANVAKGLYANGNPKPKETQ